MATKTPNFRATFDKLVNPIFLISTLYINIRAALSSFLSIFLATKTRVISCLPRTLFVGACVKRKRQLGTQFGTLPSSSTWSRGFFLPTNKLF
ncbi:hypothetical protein BDV40DRAFT_134017 [Aspergillus tamarii]|uniref:Uncharacterized protein n=1 Tax=Aspergillus tamarii TaxID=41984 RepID=A0A5N6UYZ4_ASPTM|nr:hypothetical protein BDV40DRAFT_134017 [Aspergillus tamarii]